jgi:DNA-binding NarL/FixJ family response regulator
MIGIFVVDDHRLFRDALRVMLEGNGELAVVGEAGDAREALQLLGERQCELVLVDVSLPGSNGLALVRELKRSDRQRRVVVLTMHQHPDIVCDAFAAGADGYALKHQSREELVEAIFAVAGGDRYVAPAVAAALLAPDGGKLKPRGALGILSAREREVFDLLVRGFANADVSRQLYISVKTVETHRARIMRKLDVHNIGELIRLAARQGLLAD